MKLDEHGAEKVSPESYIDQQPVERQIVLRNIRSVILANLPFGFVEVIQYGMIGYVVPHTLYPSGYHVNPKEPLPFMGLANQKNYIALYHLGIYAQQQLLKWFELEYAAQNIGKLDMGKSCIRFKNLTHVPIELIAELCQRMSLTEYVALYEKNRNSNH